MADVSIFKLDSQTITIKDTTAREAADIAKTLATTASGNATTALNKVNDLANKLYPVGSIYMSVNATNPTELFGGTWERLKDRFLLAAGDSYAAGSTGGEAEHTLTVDEMPSHGHKYDKLWTENPGNNQLASGSAGYSLKFSKNTTSGLTGGDEPHNNMPPYLAVYMWKRIV